VGAGALRLPSLCFQVPNAIWNLLRIVLIFRDFLSVEPSVRLAR